MDWDAILQLLFTLLQGILPPIIVKWVTDLVKKWKENLTPKVITGLIVPFLAFLVAVADYFLLDANFIWTFILGMGAIALHEFIKNFKSE